MYPTTLREGSGTFEALVCPDNSTNAVHLCKETQHEPPIPYPSPITQPIDSLHIGACPRPKLKTQPTPFPSLGACFCPNHRTLPILFPSPRARPCTSSPT